MKESTESMSEHTEFQTHFLYLIDSKMCISSFTVFEIFFFLTFDYVLQLLLACFSFLVVHKTMVFLKAVVCYTHLNVVDIIIWLNSSLLILRSK